MSNSLGLRRSLALAISDRLARETAKVHPLKQLFWECTLRCNLKCRHCGSDCKAQAATPDMPFEDFSRVLDGIAAHTDPHGVFVILTGGDPLMRPDLEQCGRQIYLKGFPWGMVTNGYALTPGRFERLLASGLHTMTISLDGLGEHHDWMRGREGSFDKAVQAIRLGADGRLKAFDVVTCVTARNLDELPQIRDLLVSLGVREWRLFSVFPIGRAASDPSLQLTGSQLRSMMDFIAATRKEGRISASYGCEGFLGSYEGLVRDHFFNCQAGVTVGSVLADGSISACASIRSDYHQGNIYEDDFWDVWTNRFQVMRDREWMRTAGPALLPDGSPSPLSADCGTCRHFKHCRGNGFHLRDSEGRLLVCHLKRLEGE